MLDLSRLNSEHDLHIHPCKGCVSTAMPLCHWPCSCYPNHSLGLVNDWMNEQLELDGWDYSKHLEGRAYGLVVHGDVAGIEGSRRALTDWLDWMGFVESGAKSRLDRFIGYYEPYATSHQTLDRDLPVQQEVDNVARALAAKVAQVRERFIEPDSNLLQPRAK